MNDLEKSEIALESLVLEWRTELEKKSTPATAKELGKSLQVLGIVERQAGKPEEALSHLSEACDLLNKHAPEILPDASEAKAITLQDLGNLKAAEETLREVLAVREKATASTKMAATCDHLAMNLLYQGRYPEVLPLLDRAEAISPPENFGFLAQVMAHRGRLFHTLASYSRASDAFQKALAMPINDPIFRLSLRSDLALSQLRIGKTQEAHAGIEAAANDARTLFADNPYRAIPYINNLGAIALAEDEPVIARSSFQEALEMQESHSGPVHASLIGPLNNLGVAEQALGEYDSARIHLERAAALQAIHLPPTHLRVAETERNLAYNSLLTKSADAYQHIARATQIGLDLLDRLIREGTENERLNFLERFDLVSLPCLTGDAELIANVLIASKARLLDAMLADSKPTPRITWQEIQKTIAPGTAFVDACRFTSAGTSPVKKYGAIVILPEGPPKWVELGTDESLEKWLRLFHERLRWRSDLLVGIPAAPPPLKIRAILRAMEMEFWTPLQLPNDVQHVAFSPDNRLHFLPLSALLDGKNRPLSARFLQITTVTSARDLLNAAPRSVIRENPWTVLSISNFPKSSDSTEDDPLLTLLSSLEPMPGTQIESEKIRGLAPAGSSFLSGQMATETALRTLKSAPSVLHLGCHAFFIETDDSNRKMPIDFDENSELLFAGGLVLYHGAKRNPDSPRLADDDDLLFPAEIAQLPLQGTQLVTLSSCDSGAGTPVSGEGLLGLRRAFSIAGARQVAVALWPVSDESTPRFMERFYQLALASDRPAQALWQTQSEFLSHATTEDEFELAVLRYAPFVISQNTSLTVGSRISAPSISLKKRHWLAIFSSIPLLIFLGNRFLFQRSKAG